MDQTGGLNVPYRGGGDGDSLVIETEISTLKKSFLKNYDTAFMELLNSMIRYSNHKEFYKLKEFFLTHCDNLQELPKMTDEGIDRFIEAILLVCQKWPTPLTSKGFRVFQKFLVNKQGYKNNEPVKRRFKFTKPNLSRLGLEHYIEDKENLPYAMEYCLAYLLENEHAYCKQILDSDKNSDFVIWWDRRNLHKVINELFKQMIDFKSDIQLVENIKNQLKNESFRYSTELKKEIEYVNGDVSELKGTILDLKEQIRALKSEYAKYSDLTEWKRDIDKSLDRKIHDITEMVSNEYAPKANIRNLEFLIRKHKEDYDSEFNSIKQDTTIRLKNIQDELGSRIDAKEERAYKVEAELRNAIRESDEQMLQLQTYTKNYIDKILENHDSLSQSLTKLSSETQVNFNQLESGMTKFEKYVSELNEKLYHTVSKVEMEQFIRRNDEEINKIKRDVASLNENQESHGKSLETIYKVMADNKKFLEMKFVLVDEIANKMVSFNFEVENVWTEVKWLKEKAEFLGNSLTDMNGNVFKLTNTLDQVQSDHGHALKDLSAKLEDAKKKLQDALTTSTTSLKKEIGEEIKSLQNLFLQLQSGLTNTQGDLNNFIQVDFTNLKADLQNVKTKFSSHLTEFDTSQQNIRNLRTNLDNLSSKIDNVQKTLEAQLAKEKEISSKQITEVTSQHNNLKEKVKDLDNVFNPFPRKVYSVEVKIEELSRYFGLRFNKADELEVLAPEIPNNIKPTEARKNIEPYISSLITDFKNISNKIPYYQKKVIQLTKMVSDSDKDQNRKPASNLGKVDILDHNQEPALKSPSKLVRPSGNAAEEIIMTADDVNTNLFMVRTELMTETEKMFNSLLKGQKTIEETQKDLLAKILELERKLNTGLASSDIQNIKYTLQALQDNIEKFKQITRTDYSETNKYHTKNLNVYNEKLQALENELANVKKHLLTVALSPESKSKANHDGNSSEGTAVLRTISRRASFSDKMPDNDRSLNIILKRLDLVELIADDYLELYVEKEVLKNQQKLANPTYNLEEKLVAYTYILQHYRLINNSLMVACYSKLADIFNSNKNATQLKFLKQEYFPSIYPLVKNSYDSSFPNFPILIESFLLFLAEDENSKKFLERNSFSCLMNHLEKSTKPEIRSALIKLIANLSHNDSILFHIYSNNLMIRLCKSVYPILEKFIFAQRKNLGHQDIGLSTINEEGSNRNLGQNLDMSKINSPVDKSSFPHYNEDVGDFGGNRNLDDTVGGSEKKKELVRRDFKQLELVYNALYLMYNAVQKNEFVQQCDYVSLTNYTIEISSEKQTPRQIAEISLLCVYSITQKIAIKYEQLENVNLLYGIIDYIDNQQVPSEVQDLALQVITDLCRDEKIYAVLSETVDLEKLGVRFRDQPNPELLPSNSSPFSYMQPAPYYEGSATPIFHSGEDGQYMRKTGQGPADFIRNSMKDNNLKGLRSTNNRQDSLGRRYTAKDRGMLPNNHAVNRTIDNGSLQATTNLKGSNKKPTTRDDSFDSLKDKGEAQRARSKKNASANFQLPTLNSAVGRPLFKNQ